MNSKIGRNDPCLCGSGKKYKHCCGASSASASSSTEPSDGGIQRALSWLHLHHRKAWAAALESAFDDAVFEIFDDEDEAAHAVKGMGDELFHQVQINLTEWLLAEGEIMVKGEWMRIAELLLGARGPLLAVGERAWLEQLARQPLRLYDVTEVAAGTGFTLCDALNTEESPVVVTEDMGSRSMRVGMQIGVRLMEVAGQHQLSGALYPFSAWAGRALLERLRGVGIEPGALDEDDQMMLSLTIIEDWLAQFLTPAPLPQIIDSSTGEPMLFTTDHYEVHDWVALSAALAAQLDVEGERKTGWDRLVKGADGLTRSRATIRAQADGQRLAVQYKTAGLAERGRPWFNALAGASVRFQLTEVSDPKGMLAHRAEGTAALPQPTSLPAGLDPAALADAMAKVIHSSYANWADEPIPALDGRTPRQAIAGAAGLERVKGLLRSYEDGEARMAAQQGRGEISYQFLWDSLGLLR